MSFWFQENYVLGPGESVIIEYTLGGGRDFGAQVAMPVNYLAANRWLVTTAQGLEYRYETGQFVYFAEFVNRDNTATANFQVRGGGLT